MGIQAGLDWMRRWIGRNGRSRSDDFVPPTALDRPLSKDEDAALRWILSLEDFPGADELRAQAAHVRAIWGRTTELGLEVTDAPPAPVRDGVLPVSADVVGADGEPIGFITIWVKDGYLSSLEYSWVTERMPTEYPSLHQLRASSTRMGLPAGYEFRAPTRDDVDAVANVLLADQRADGVEPTLDAHFIRQVWSRPDFDLAVDAWVVTDGVATIVAYGQVRREESDVVGSWGVVHPEHRGRGIGSSLFDRIEARAAGLLAGVSSPRFRHSISAGDGAAAAMVRVRGLQPLRHFWHMQIDLTGPIEPGPAPAGIEIGGIEIGGIEPPDDLRVIHAILDAAFADDPGYHPEPFELWAEELVGSPSYDPMLCLLARDGGVPVGALTASAGDDGGWVDWLAVLASHRGRGIGLALLRRAFALFASRGLRRVILNVDAENVTGATAVYERVGMRVVNRWDLWERSSAAPR